MAVNEQAPSAPLSCGRAARLQRFAYLVGQHPVRGHRALLRRGLLLGWLDEFNRYAAEPGLPIDTPAGFQALRYQYAVEYVAAAASRPETDWYEHPSARALLFSHTWRRESYPLRWWPWAWALRGCRSVLEYGAGVAPYAHGMTRAWPGRLPQITVADQPGPFLDYCRWRFANEPSVHVSTLGVLFMNLDGIVATEVFEHLPDPVNTARWMRDQARVIVFDYVENAGEPSGRRARAAVLEEFHGTGQMTGPTHRGMYVWRR